MSFYLLTTVRLLAAIIYSTLLVACSSLDSLNSYYETKTTEPAQINVNDAIARGDAALLAGQTDEALGEYVNAVNTDKKNDETFYKIGAIHAERGNFVLAKEAYQMALQISPKHVGALEGLGLLQLENRHYPEAKQNLKVAINIDTKRWRAYNGLGLIADQQKEHQSAIIHYTNALKNQPNSPQILNNRGYSKYIAGDWVGANHDYQSALLINPKFDLALHNLGLLQTRQGKESEALQTFKKTMDEASACNNIGYIYMLDNKYPEAEELLQRAITLSPNYNEQAQKNIDRLHELWQK